MSKSRTVSVEKRLNSYLVKAQGNCGREGKVVAEVAAHLGKSVHTVQSVALGRRKLRDAEAARLDAWLKRHGG